MEKTIRRILRQGKWVVACSLVIFACLGVTAAKVVGQEVVTGPPHPRAVTFFGGAGNGGQLNAPGITFSLGRISPQIGTNAPVAANSSIAGGVALPANRPFYYTSGTVPPTLDSMAAPGSTPASVFADITQPAQPGVVPVTIPAGVVPPTSDPLRYGNTEEQAANSLRRIQALLTAQGLSLNDVYMVIAYVTPDPYLRSRLTADANGFQRLVPVPQAEIQAALNAGKRVTDPDFPGQATYDYQGWFRAYARFFDSSNPTRANTFTTANAITRSPILTVSQVPPPESGATAVKVARSSLGIPSLVSTGWLFEAEALVTYPPRKPQ